MLAEAGALDFGDLLLVAHAPAARRADACARAWPSATRTCSSTTPGPRPRAGALAAAAGREHATCLRRRRRPGDPALPRRGDEPADFAERPDAAGRAPGALACAAGRRSSTRPQAVAVGDRARAGSSATAARWRSGAAPTSAPRRRRVAADVERLHRPRGRRARVGRVLVRSVRNEGQAVAVALEERAVPLPARRRGGVLPARRDPRRPGLAAAARRPRRRRRGRARARAAAGRAALGRPRPLHPDRAPAQARHGLRAGRGDRVAADPARGARAHPRLPASSTARPPAALDTARPDLFVHRLIERLGLRRQQLFAAQADVVERLVNLAKLRRAGHGLRAPLAAGHAARVRALHRRRRRGRAARGGGERPRPQPRRRCR